MLTYRVISSRQKIAVDLSGENEGFLSEITLRKQRQKGVKVVELSFFLVCSLSTILHFSIFADLYFSEILNNLPKAKTLKSITRVNKAKLQQKHSAYEHLFLQ